MERPRGVDRSQPVWTGLADVLIQRAALIARLGDGRPPDPLAGIKVDDEEVVRLLGELPGLRTAPVETVQAIDEALQPRVDQAREEYRCALAGDGPFARLTRQAALSPVESEVLGILCAVELDPRRQRLVGYLNDDITQSRLTPWTIRQLWAAEDGFVAAIAPGRGLDRAALARVSDAPWGSSSVAVAPTVLWWLNGAEVDDPDLPPGVERISARPDGSAPLTDASILVAAGPDRRRRLQALADALGHKACVVSPLPGSTLEWEALIRQATLTGEGVIVEVAGDLLPSARDRIERAGHLSWGISSVTDLPVADLPRRPWQSVRVEEPRVTAAEWTETFGTTGGPSPRLSADQLHAAGVAAQALGGDVSAALRRLAAGHLDATATIVHPTRSWPDLVLDPDRLNQVREIAVRCRHRDTVFDRWGFAPLPSVGVVALFTGPSGTGKTLAAEVVAADLGVDLYKVDLAHLVSKFIGETEKNLSKVFDAAEAANVALFFDEADALLGRRSAVSDAHDRYANIEVAYLLQRLESYQGLAVLATNLASNLDPAFVRRMHVVVEFPVPGPAERRRIWTRSIPDQAPVSADLDLAAVADQLELTGGTIRNAALGAAFMAAEAGQPISLATVVAAVEREFRKSGRIVNAADFGQLRPPDTASVGRAPRS